MLAALHAAVRFSNFLLIVQKKVTKKRTRELMRFLQSKTAAGPGRSRLSFRFAKRLSARYTAIAGNSGFLFANIRQSRMRLLVKKRRINASL